MKKGVWINVVFLFGSLFLSLCLVEILLRLTTDPLNEEIEPLRTTGNLGSVFRFDRNLGWSLRPSIKSKHKRVDYKYSFSTNRYAMRAKEIHLKPSSNAIRIALLGDSFTWGYGVKSSARYGEGVESRTNIEIANFSVPGYGPAQSLNQMAQVLSFQPKIIILGFCLGNDWGDTVMLKRYGYYKPFYALNSSDEIELKGYPIPNVAHLTNEVVLPASAPVRWLLLNSRIAYRIALFGERWDSENERRGSESGELTGFKDLMIYHPAALNQHKTTIRNKAIKINSLVIKQIKHNADQAGVKLVLLAVPSKCEYTHNCDGVTPEVNRSAIDALSNIASEHGIPIIDPVNQLNIADFYEHDGHWNESGHAKIASAIIEWFQGHPEYGVVVRLPSPVLTVPPKETRRLG